MELEVKAAKKIEDGKHEGVIVGIEYRENPHKYTDVIIEFEEGKRLKYGVPTAVTPVSKLGKLLLDFGVDLVIGEKVEPEALIGKQCTFMTMIGEKGFSNIVKGSVKPC